MLGVDLHTPGPTTFELVIRLVSVVAWPAVVVIGIIVLRNPISRLLDRLKEFSGAGVKAGFATLVAKIEEKNAPALKALPHPGPGTSSSSSSGPDVDAAGLVMAVGRESNVGAVLGIWARIEDLIGEILMQRGTPRSTFRGKGLRLAELNLLTGDELRLLEALRKARNVAAHSPSSEISNDDLYRFADMAAALLRKLYKIKSTGN